MDCVACEKCRLWGKLQVSGLGTALKILFSYGDRTNDYQLSRTEVVSLLNAFGRLSSSLSEKELFEEMLRERARASRLATPLYQRAVIELNKLLQFALDQENRKIVALSALLLFISTAMLFSKSGKPRKSTKTTRKE